jgi:hypothetical protein
MELAINNQWRGQLDARGKGGHSCGPLIPKRAGIRHGPVAAKAAQADLQSASVPKRYDGTLLFDKP